MRKRLLILFIFCLCACAAPYKAPDLGGLYNGLAQNESPQRNPVILIPGLLGSKLISSTTGEMAWGAFGIGGSPSDSPTDLRLISLPMQPDTPLRLLRDDLEPGGALDRVIINFMGYPLALNTYTHILGVLGVGGYRDQQLSEAGMVDYGDRHFTCFQFDYDWRRDIIENAQALDRFILDNGPGDGVVLRSSALMDERHPEDNTMRLVSPIQWRHVLFLFSDHLEITKNSAFTDNLLYFLLESQRN